MKKITTFIAAGAAIATIGAGAIVLTNANKPQDTTSENNSQTGIQDYKNPTLVWWELYNPNGFDTLTAEIHNPNSEAVDVSYDVVYLKDGEEVARNEDFGNFSIPANGKSIIWANVNIPKSSDVDEVKLSDIVVSKTGYPPVNGNYKYLGVTDGEALFDFEFEKQPALADITFLLYNDKNGNKKFDKGEIVVTSTDSLTSQKGRVSFDTEGYNYTDFEVYYNAY